MKTTRKGRSASEIKAAVKAIGGLRLSVGWFESAKYPDGTPVAGVMAVQEFGSEKMKIPPRAPMRITHANKRNDWENLTSKMSERIMLGKMTIDQAGDFLGMTVVGDVQRTISRGLQPGLKESTLYNRKHRLQPNASEKPLVDTRVAFNTLTFTKEKK